MLRHQACLYPRPNSSSPWQSRRSGSANRLGFFDAVGVRMMVTPTGLQVGDDSFQHIAAQSTSTPRGFIKDKTRVHAQCFGDQDAPLHSHRHSTESGLVFFCPTTKLPQGSFQSPGIIFGLPTPGREKRTVLMTFRGFKLIPCVNQPIRRACPRYSVPCQNRPP